MTQTEISAREADVLMLVGEHLTNAEIGARLFISVRTVESHVSSLLRKLDVPDRRALAQRASGTARRERSGSALPPPLTSFIGRQSERAELIDLVKANRQVTAVGPGGVGKTRLATAVAADAAEEYPGGVWFVDLVSITEPGLVAAAVADRLGLGEQPGLGMDETVTTALADRHALLVLDNCEHIRDGVAPFVERLLAACPATTVLATGRARLMVPFERVYQVPPMSLAGGSRSDAVDLFIERAGSASGWPPEPGLRDRIASICERLEGLALAIELAAARWPTLGLDGLSAGLIDPLRVLAGGTRADERHSSIRAVLDWSHALVEPADRRLLRRVSLFLAPFTVEAAAEIADTEIGVVADGLARLAEQSLLIVTDSRAGTEYRMLETIRQYGMERLTEAGEVAEARSRYLRSCLSTAADLTVVREDWRARFDTVADDLRAGLAWAVDQPDRRAEAFRLARHLAELTFTRNLVGESQQRHEQAAELADDPAEAAAMLRQAAAVAGCRARGDDMYRLHLAAADTARRSGDARGAAIDLATAAFAVHRFDTQFERVPTQEEAAALVAEARDLAGDDPAALAAVVQAEGGKALTDTFAAAEGPDDDTMTETIAQLERAVDLAHRARGPLAESAALDALTVAQNWAGDVFDGAATARRRIALLPAATDGPAKTLELINALGNATDSCLVVGDLPGARELALRLAGHPFLAEVGHRATSWLLVVDALAGNVDDVLTNSVRFRDAWQRAGSPAPRMGLGPPAAAVAMVHGLRGDDAARHDWNAIADRLDPSPWRTDGYGAVFDAMLLLHRGQVSEALERLTPAAGEERRRISWIWLHWHVALGAEAAVLAGSSGARTRVVEAETVVAGNPVAGAIVERARALLDGDPERLVATAEALEAAGSRYQSARSLLLADPDKETRPTPSDP